MSSATLTLEPRLDLKSATRTAGAIQAFSGQDLTLDARDVTHLGAMGLQVLRAAARSWAEAGQTLDLVNPSNDCIDQMVLLGFTPQTITQWEDAA